MRRAGKPISLSGDSRRGKRSFRRGNIGHGWRNDWQASAGFIEYNGGNRRGADILVSPNVWQARMPAPLGGGAIMLGTGTWKLVFSLSASLALAVAIGWRASKTYTAATAAVQPVTA